MMPKDPERPEAKGEVEGMSARGLSCAKCGKPREEWTDDEGRGVEREGDVYCCEACARTGAAAEEPEKADPSFR